MNDYAKGVQYSLDRHEGELIAIVKGEQFGFIKTDKGDVFLPRKEVRAAGLADAKPGTALTFGLMFQPGIGRKPVAVNVKRAGDV